MEKICKDCKILKPVVEFSTAAYYKDKIYYRGECTLCTRIKQNTPENRKRESEYRKNSIEYRSKANAYKRSEKYREKERIRDKKRRDIDYLYRMKKNLRSRLRIALKVKSWYKIKKFKNYIGCTREELRFHIENQFQIGMTWDNYGHGKEKWTLDHIIPLSSAKTPSKMYKLCHYTNIQPMWYIENIKKSNKIAA